MVASQPDASRTRAAGALAAAAAAHPGSGSKQQQHSSSSSKHGSPAAKGGQPALDTGGSPLRSGLQQHKQQQQQAGREPLIPASRPGDAGVEERANDLQHYATELQSVTARLAGYAAALRHGSSNEPQQLLTVELPATAASEAASPASPASSFNLKLADPSHIAALRDQLALSNSLVQQRAQSASPTKQPGHTAIAAAGGHGSRVSQRSQPQGSSQQQQQQVPHAASATNRPGTLAAAVSALVAGSSAPQQLLQHQQQPSSVQELAAAGLRQMQQVTEVTQLLQPTIAAHRAVVDEVAPKLQQLQRVLHANPQLADPGGLSALVSRLTGLEREVRAEQQARAASDEALTAERRALQARELAHNNTLKVLQQQTHTPRDTRCAALQAANSTLEQALLRKGAEIEALRAELQRTRRQHQQHPSGSSEGDDELSPVRPEGQRYDDPSSSTEGPLPSGGVRPGHTPHAAVYVGGSDNTSSSGNTGGGRSSAYGSSSSRSGTPGSEDSSSLGGSLTKMQRLQQQQQQQGPARYSAGLQPQQRGPGAVQQQEQEQQQQVPSLRRHVSAGAERQQPGSLGEALQLLQDQGGMIQALQRQLHLQEQEAAALRAQGEASFRRQLEVEKRQHMHTKQAGELLRCQAEQLQQQLADACAREVTAQAAAAAAADGHLQRQRADDGGSSGGHAASAAAWQQQSQRLQVHVDALKAENGAMQQCLHNLYSHVRGAGQLAPAPLSALGAASGAGGDGGNLMLRLEVSVQRLLADATARQAAAVSEQQQLELLQHDNAGLRQQVLRLQQQNEALERHNAACKAEVQRQTDNLLRTEHVLLKLQQEQGQQAGTQLQALAQQCRQLQQALDDARAEASAAQQAAAAATAAAQQQAASAASERSVLMDRVRQLADMAAQADARRSSSYASTSHGPDAQQHSRRASAGSDAGDAAHQQQQQRLQQDLFVLRGQLADAQGKEERLQVANAQMQERLVRLQVAAASAGGGHASEQLQAAVAALQQQNQQLHQQLAAAAGGDAQQQQQQQAPASSELEQQVLKLQDALEQRTRELDEWQTHADALECDLEDMKDRVQAAEEAAAAAQEQLAAVSSRGAPQPQPGDSASGQQLAAAKARLRQLEHDLHGAQADRAALTSRLEAATAELGATRQAAADLRLRLEHFTGPSGPHARLRQLEASLQNAQRRADAAETRAAAAAADVASLTSRLGTAEGEIVALEGHISVLEDALAAQQQQEQQEQR